MEEMCHPNASEAPFCSQRLGPFQKWASFHCSAKRHLPLVSAGSLLADFFADSLALAFFVLHHFVSFIQRLQAADRFDLLQNSDSLRKERISKNLNESTLVNSRRRQSSEQLAAWVLPSSCERVSCGPLGSLGRTGRKRARASRPGLLERDFGGLAGGWKWRNLRPNRLAASPESRQRTADSPRGRHWASAKAENEKEGEQLLPLIRFIHPIRSSSSIWRAAHWQQSGAAGMSTRPASGRNWAHKWPRGSREQVALGMSCTAAMWCNVLQSAMCYSLQCATVCSVQCSAGKPQANCRARPALFLLCGRTAACAQRTQSLTGGPKQSKSAQLQSAVLTRSTADCAHHANPRLRRPLSSPARRSPLAARRKPLGVARGSRKMCLGPAPLGRRWTDQWQRPMVCGETGRGQPVGAVCARPSAPSRRSSTKKGRLLRLRRQSGQGKGRERCLVLWRRAARGQRVKLAPKVKRRRAANWHSKSSPKLANSLGPRPQKSSSLCLFRPAFVLFSLRLGLSLRLSLRRYDIFALSIIK